MSAGWYAIRMIGHELPLTFPYHSMQAAIADARFLMAVEPSQAFQVYERQENAPILKACLTRKVTVEYVS